MQPASDGALETPVAVANKVLDAVEGLRNRIVSLTSELIRIPSINPKYPGMDYQKEVGGETACNRRLAEVYREIGCKVDFVMKAADSDSWLSEHPPKVNFNLHCYLLVLLL